MLVSAARVRPTGGTALICQHKATAVSDHPGVHVLRDLLAVHVLVGLAYNCLHRDHASSQTKAFANFL
jgi:hypothetical protein